MILDGRVGLVLTTRPRISLFGEYFKFGRIQLLIYLIAASRCSGQFSSKSILLYSSLPRSDAHMRLSWSRSILFMPLSRPLTHGE